MKPFDKALYEANMVAVGKVLAKYNAFSQSIIMRDIGQEIIKFLKKEGLWFEETGSLEDLERLVKHFLDNGFADKLEVIPAPHGNYYIWHDLLLLSAYKELQDITGSPFLSCPMNLCLSSLCSQHGKYFKLHDKTFDMEKRITTSNWELVDAAEIPNDEPDPLAIDNARLFELAEERANHLEEARRALEQTNRELEAAKQHAEEQAARLEAQTLELEKARMEADKAAKVKADFLANMSHEIRTPMNGVIGMASLLDSTPLNEEQKDLVDTLNQSGKALLDIINSILDLSKIEAGKMQLRKHSFEPHSLMVNLIRVFVPECNKKNIEIRLVWDDTIPHRLIGDEARICQVMTNLIGNAVKFTFQGSITVELSVESIEKDKLQLWAAVSDTGPGIDTKLQEDLFNRFSQINELDELHPGGSGLGLNISQKLVQLMGGDIFLQSTPGKGSTFSFSIPLLTFKENDTADIVETPMDLPVIEPDLSILLVDDNQTNRKVAMLMLKHMGLDAEQADNGFDALDKLNQQRFDIVLMDCQMPQMDGFCATRKLRNGSTINRDCIVVAMTAQALEGDKEKCLKAGMNDYLSKPIKPNRLASMLAKWQDTALATRNTP